jgi:chromosome partitioning protein
MPHIIVLGNEKGGTGKSTVAMHILTGLLDKGFDVGSIDVDARQGTLTRYVENRRYRIEKTGVDLRLPDHIPLLKSNKETIKEAQEEDFFHLNETLNQFKDKDFILVDTPGNDTYLSRLVHSHADTLITPLNDSFIDLDMLVRVNADYTILKPSVYAETVWEQRKVRAIRGGKPIDWVVLRNRLSSIYSHNKQEMEKVLSALSKRIGFRLVQGFGERVIFRELFLSGLTLLDMKKVDMPMSLSHVAAKQELADLFKMLDLPLSKKK